MHRFPSSLSARSSVGVMSSRPRLARPAFAQEPPYFVTYSSALEEPDNLELAFKGTQGAPKDANSFASGTLEMEYGVRAWWTTELYLQGQTTANDSTIFTGFRLENRFRVLPREHWINPVAYIEYEDTNFADRSFLEVTGHTNYTDYQVPNGVARTDVERAIEGKLILSSNFHNFNISENFIFEKNLKETSEAGEFGYAVGISRALKQTAGGKYCLFCRENFAVGGELYGGLGDTNDFGLHATQQYAAPTVALNVPKGPTIMFSPNFGLNDNSLGVLWRFSASYEFQQISNWFRHGGPQ